MYVREDPSNKKRRLEHLIEDYEVQEFPCQYDLSTGRVECFASCVSDMIDVPCPEKVKFEAERQFQTLQTHPLVQLAFSNPNLASLNDFLQEEKVVYGHRSVDRYLPDQMYVY
jgi:hypothetical protein